MTDGDVDQDVQYVIDLELRLHSPQVRSSPSQVDELLHSDFVEFGSSGRRWDRESMLAMLANEDLASESAITAVDLAGFRLSEDVVLVTYVSEHGDSRARRSALWTKTAEGTWRLYFHQGTLIPNT